MAEKKQRSSEALSECMFSPFGKKVREGWEPRDCGKKTIGTGAGEVNRFL